ncbi:hypothetical protein [Paenibacillus sp. HJGM_3]|uniref:hypothetical protein n=1 Tax=Paenibacillus sp. HJGM_3 TaxID=3379816 RepID=UPI00385D8101
MKADAIEIIDVPVLQFIIFQGKSSLDWTGLPEQGGWVISKIVNQIKRITKETLGYQFKLMPAEYIWHKKHDDGQWSFTQFMQVPDIVTYDMYDKAKSLVDKRYIDQLVPVTRFISEKQGLCAQKLHRGHHYECHLTFDEIVEYINQKGYKIRGERREILVNWCSPISDRWSTIVRVPIE